MHKMNILIAAGGTGGHIIPAITIGRSMSKANVYFVRGNRHIEKTVYNNFNIDSLVLNFNGYSNIIDIMNMILSIPKMIYFIIKKKIDTIIMMGSYMTFSTGIAAIITQKPLFLMEQDSITGKNIRCLSIFANKVFTGFKSPYRGILSKKRIYIGHIINENAIPQETENVYFKDNKPIILIIGGSQGALGMFSPLYNIFKNNSQYNIIMIGSVIQNKFEERTHIKILPYQKHMGKMYYLADFIISRAGVLSLAEIINTGKPALFIPLPFATDDHQKRNIEKYIDTNKQVDLLEEKYIDRERLMQKISKLISIKTKTDYHSNALLVIKETIHYV